MHMPVACKFCIHMPASEHMQWMSDAHYELALGLPECMCGRAGGIGPAAPVLAGPVFLR